MLTEAQKQYLSRLNDDALILGWLIWGEAEDQSVAGRVAVANVPLNRVKRNIPARWGGDLRSVMLWPMAFQGLARVPVTMYDDIARSMLSPYSVGALSECTELARAAIAGLLTDPSMRATHFHVWNDPASWSTADTMHFTKRVDDHLFYYEE